MIRALGLHWIIVFLMLGLAPLSAPAAAAPARESLEYQISLGPWDDVARVHLTLTETAPGRYLAEFAGAAQGMWKLLSRWLPERYQTEMVYQDGRLKPLVYREEFINKGQHVVKEYRFDYERQRLTFWRQADDGQKVKKWEVPLKEPVYDLLSLFYNVRLGVLGPLPGGSSLRVAVLPAPEPREMVFRIGENTSQGRKVMLNFRQPEAATADQYYIYLNGDRVPTLAWTRVTFFGKLTGQLLNPGGVKKEGLVALPPAPGPVLGVRR
ncbi:MAG: DUF3108 domain-containing protein [Syntrophobacterales bacterium]|nr:DUF3108 domain-containing protein [Syntrophobacterales bacterium]